MVRLTRRKPAAYRRSVKQPYVDDVLVSLKIAAFRNSVRLFQDACTLYASRAYPSAFALGVLAYEELGKACHVQRITENIEDDPGSEDFWYEALVTSPVMTDPTSSVHKPARVSMGRERV